MGERGGSQGKWWPFSTFEAVSASFVPDTREERCGVAGWWRQALPADFIGRKDVKYWLLSRPLRHARHWVQLTTFLRLLFSQPLPVNHFQSTISVKDTESRPSDP